MWQYSTSLVRPVSVKVIPNGFDLEKFFPDKTAKDRLLRDLGLHHEIGITSSWAEKEKGEGHTFLIGFIARYDPVKDHPTFIKAACQLLKRRNNTHFVLAGRDIRWDNHGLTRQVPDIWRSHFHFLGERDDIEAITAGLDIASSVSYGEGFSNILCEAMACGIPCVATNVGDSSEIIGDTGRIIATGRPIELSNAWDELIELPEEKRLVLGMAARKRIVGHYNLNEIVKQYEVLYGEFGCTESSANG